MAAYFSIILTVMLVNNYVLAQFLGICPFLGVSKKLDSAVGMSAAVTFVMVLATLKRYGKEGHFAKKQQEFIERHVEELAKDGVILCFMKDFIMILNLM